MRGKRSESGQGWWAWIMECMHGMWTMVVETAAYIVKSENIYCEIREPQSFYDSETGILIIAVQTWLCCVNNNCVLFFKANLSPWGHTNHNCILFLQAKLSSWGRTNTCRRCGARSKVMWCASCCVCAAGSIANCQLCTVPPSPPAPTKPVALAIEQSRVSVTVKYNYFRVGLLGTDAWGKTTSKSRTTAKVWD